MPWPSSTDYNEAIQNPQHCFGDAELRAGQPALNPMGLPWPRSGNNADVYKIISAAAKPWAVKCFTREPRNLRERYQAISDHLGQKNLAFMVRFQYLEQGIRVGGQWYPAVKMRWVEGHTLNELIRQFIDRPQIIDRLAQLWLRLAPEMRAAKIIHGDLQHDNVLLVPRKNLAKLRLRLIDYDGMTVPALINRPSGELGHRNYQHPQRLREGGHNVDADRFPHLIIYTAFRCLVAAGKPLWDHYESGDNLLFREKDFQEPNKSPLFAELLDSKDAISRALAGHLLLASHGEIGRVPLLGEIAPAGEVQPLSAWQRDRVQAIMSGNGAALPPPPVVTVTLVEEEANVEPETPAAGGPSLVRSAAGLATRAVHGAITWGRGRPEWSARSLGAIAAVGLGVMLLALVAGVVARSLRIPAGPLPESIFAPTSPVVKQLPQLAPIDNIALNVGDTMIKVAFHRRGYTGPIEVSAEELPDGVTLKDTVPMPKEDAVILVLHAALRCAEKDGSVELQLRAGSEPTQKQTVPLKVRKPSVSSVGFTPNELNLLAGEIEPIHIVVRRDFYQGPIEVLLTELPQGVTSEPVTIPAGQNTGTLSLHTHPNMPQWNGRVAGLVRIGDYDVGAWKMPAVVHRPPPGMRLVPIPPIAVKTGDKQTVQVTVDRRGYRGPIEVKLEPLPPGVTCKPSVITGNEGLATLEVVAERKVTDGQYQLEVVMSVGSQAFDRQKVTLKVEKGKLARLPEQELQGK